MDAIDVLRVKDSVENPDVHSDTDVVSTHAYTSIFGSNLTQEDLTKEGIFRKSGSVLRQSELKDLISAGITVDLTANRFTVHDCCSVLKKFCSELPEPLITESLFPLFKHISQLSRQSLSPNHSQHNDKKLTALQLFTTTARKHISQLSRQSLSPNHSQHNDKKLTALQLFDNNYGRGLSVDDELNNRNKLFHEVLSRCLAYSRDSNPCEK
ncbi:unnamed protein product [Oppiella nova]|uniref:Rho-GAP domain-containing protein n=1 Tax=Oppiella nova TaxID=334625 RepID=A0A7R9L7Y9_9ACAR|nr:unnamed protein product [Oppiella nova]CAG2158048.1 unnamed protein product [Oppiella nova]